MKLKLIKNKKIAVITTIRNEERGIEKFLDSILNQSIVPDEIVIVDGGSTDRTADIIKRYEKCNSSIKLITKDGCNISQGRNIAIKNSNSEIIAVTDAGCILDDNWLRNITRPIFEGKAMAVGGNYMPHTTSDFEECLALLTFKTLNYNEEEFLPSSRSIAFEKSVWEEVGGYPEWLYTAEDTLFDKKIKKKGHNIYFAKEAVVFWQPRSSYKKVFKQYYLYSRGDAHAELFTKMYLVKLAIYFFILIELLTFSYFSILGLILWLLFSLRNYGKILAKYKFPKYLFSTVCITTYIDVSSIFGFIKGYVQRKIGKIPNRI